MDQKDDEAAARIRGLAGHVNEAVNAQVSSAAQHQIDEHLTMPGVGAISRELDPMNQQIQDAVAEAMERLAEPPKPQESSER